MLRFKINPSIKNNNDIKKVKQRLFWKKTLKEHFKLNLRIINPLLEKVAVGSGLIYYN